jgi:hypothetical protein
LQQLAPGGLAFLTGNPHIQHHAAAVGTHTHGHQDRHASALLADPHTGIPTVQEQVADFFGGEIARRPRGELITGLVNPRLSDATVSAIRSRRLRGAHADSNLVALAQGGDTARALAAGASGTGKLSQGQPENLS